MEILVALMLFLAFLGTFDLDRLKPRRVSQKSYVEMEAE